MAKLRKRRADPKPGGWVGQQRAPTDVVVGDSQDRWQIAGPEAMVKVCGVAMARLPGHSWAPTSSTGRMSERGNRLAGPLSGQSRSGGRERALSADAGATGRRTRSSPSRGKPGTWRGGSGGPMTRPWRYARCVTPIRFSPLSKKRKSKYRDHWRAVCFESCKHGSEGGGWKRDRSRFTFTRTNK